MLTKPSLRIKVLIFGGLISPSSLQKEGGNVAKVLLFKEDLGG
jgi:hypothetical protein